MDSDATEGFSPDEATAGATNSVWGHIEGAGHAVAGAWDVLNGSLNHAMSEGLRLIGDNEDADMSDRFMQQRWDSATEHFKQMHKDFDGTTDGATNSLDAQGDGDQGDGDGESYDGDTDPSYGDGESDEGESDDSGDYSDDYAQDSFDAASDGDMGDGGDDGDEGE